MLSSDLHIDIILVFFIYGLAFFSMGLAMMMEARRSPLLAEARVLRPLAVFGFVHGIHEWLEMVLLKGEWLGLNFPPQMLWVRLGFLVASFASLIVFGLQVMRPQRKRLSKTDIYIGAGLLGFYGFLVVIMASAHQNNPTQWLEHADALARYALAVPGAALAALALNRQAWQAQDEGRRHLGSSLRFAAWCFAFYSLTQIFVPAVDMFPAYYLNAELFTQWTGMPIQVVRAVLAVLITFGLIRATQVVEDERENQLVTAQQAQLEALEQIQRDLVERESLRRELLRHTVLAQEEERTRIARELHDETAQFLTALSLNLATLRNSVPKTREVNELVDRLQMLSRRMSQGIYRMVHDLRPAQLDDLGLVAALQYLADEERRIGLEIALEVSGPHQRLDPLVETVLFRVAQEALTNVARHAQADSATVELQFAPQQVSLRIIDRGVGFDPDENHTSHRGWGLAGMVERVESVGGRLNIYSMPGSGTIVEMVVDLLKMKPSTLEENADEYHSLNVS